MREFLTSTFEIVGLALISLGVGIAYFPAGLVAAGASLCLIGYLTATPDSP